MENFELQLIETDKLIEELFNRYEHGVIALERRDKTDSTLGNYKIRWKGCGFMASGLANAAIEDINTYRRANEKLEGRDGDFQDN